MSKTEKKTVDFDKMKLEDLKQTVNVQLLDAQENQKYKRTTKSKRMNKQIINFFGSIAYYLDQLESETNGSKN